MKKRVFLGRNPRQRGMCGRAVIEVRHPSTATNPSFLTAAVVVVIVAVVVIDAITTNVGAQLSSSYMTRARRRITLRDGGSDGGD